MVDEASSEEWWKPVIVARKQILLWIILFTYTIQGAIYATEIMLAVGSSYFFSIKYTVDSNNAFNSGPGVRRVTRTEIGYDKITGSNPVVSRLGE